jgi:two-component system chemotaxis response regulator CheY
LSIELNRKEKKENNMKVLVVDDSLIIRKTILGYLKGFENVEVVGASIDGYNALEIFRKTNPDIVTLDLTLPGIDGIDVLKEMMKINPNVKVVVITALKDKSTGLKAIQLGARGYIVKPFNLQKFTDVFNSLN